jgi:hypothetical protein
MKDNQHDPPGQNKTTQILVNTVEHQWPEKKISFEEVVKLAFPDPKNKEFDVTFARGNSPQEGELLEGKSMPVHPGLEFTVTPTNES